MAYPSPATPLMRAHSALTRGDAAGAASLCRSMLLKRATDTEARYLLGLALATQGDAQGAIDQWRQVLRTVPRHFPSLVNLGMALSQQHPPEAINLLRTALTLDASHATVHYGLGNALLAQGEAAAAAIAFESAVQRDPGFVDAWNNLGVSLRLQERLTDAVAALRRALALDGTRADARDNLADVQHALGVTLHRAGQLEAAVAAYDQSIALCDSNAASRRDRARALESLQRLGEALRGFQDAVLLAQEPDTLAGLLSCSVRICAWQTRAQALARLRQQPLGVRAIHPFLSLSVCEDPAEQREIAAARSGAVSRDVSAESTAGADRVADLPAPRRAGPGRIRIAYVSSDLRDHAVAQLLVGVLEQHDRRRYEVHAVSLQPRDDHSAIGRRLAAAVDHFHDVAHLNDADTVQLVRNAGIDIAVDLNVHTVGGRLGLFARRLAPIQASYLGYAGTSGAPWMDFLLADGIVIPAGAESLYSERVVRLPNCYLPNDDQRLVADIPTRTQAGLPERGFVFCAFTNVYKISEPMFALWLRLLAMAPGSVLWLRAMGDEAAANLRQAAAVAGIDPQRLVFAPQVPDTAGHLARLALADLFLDTLPYNAHSTTCEALWSGVPVLTCSGRTFAGRVAASALTAAGLQQLIAPHLQGYESMALQLARDASALRDLRLQVAAARHSALFDTQGYTRGLEAGLEQMLQLADLPPRPDSSFRLNPGPALTAVPSP